jgi:hypothetical protein
MIHPSTPTPNLQSCQWNSNHTTTMVRSWPWCFYLSIVSSCIEACDMSQLFTQSLVKQKWADCQANCQVKVVSSPCNSQVWTSSFSSSLCNQIASMTKGVPPNLWHFAEKRILLGAHGSDSLTVSDRLAILLLEAGSKMWPLLSPMLCYPFAPFVLKIGST